MTIESEVAALTQATTDLLAAVNVRKATLDDKVTDADTFAQASQTSANNAAASAATATTRADQAAGSAASALAIYGNTAAQQAAVTAAQNAASVAAGHAASASSVVQQDLSGVTAAALHRSPNAVTAMFVYDTSKDSDGGAWTEKCQHTSWYNEPLNGKWLGAQASEAAARAAAGATTGDYFQLTTNGAFYKLNATSGITEVFRGNKRKFPRLAAIVSQSSAVTIYDLTEPGRPMWMNFGDSPIFSSSMASISAVNGIVSVASATTYGRLAVVNFPKDTARGYRGISSTNATQGDLLGGIARRQTALLDNTQYRIANDQCNAVAMTVLPDAPVDPVTGLQVPTIAVATAGGPSVIRHDGTVKNPYGTALASNTVHFGSRGELIFHIGENGKNYRISPAPYDAYSSYVNSPITPLGMIYPISDTVNYVNKNRNAAIRSTTQTGIFFFKDNANGSRSSAALVTSRFNTGHMVGDIRRTYLADVGAESISSVERFAETFETGIAGWTVEAVSAGSVNYNPAGTSVSWDSVGKRLALSSIDVNNRARVNSASSIAGFTIGKTYEVIVERGLDSQAQVQLFVINGAVGVVKDWFPVPYGAARTTFVAAAATVTLSINAFSAGVAYIDNIIIREVVADRSYKAQGANITGTLTKTAVASAAQLVAYSGFSASNYLREPYSADLDFGTGEWTVSAWVSIPTANAAAGIIASRAHSSGAYITLGIDATNKLTATANDGTTTRTATTSAAYNTATWLKVRANYTTDGTLALLVNGQEVAVTRGAPLLTLNNSNAVLTIGNSYALDAPFPGSIALLKFSATVPTPEQSVWMYEQEKHMFRDGAQCCLPDSGNIVDLTYDDATDKWIAVSATNQSEWSGLACTSVKAVPAGSFSKVVATSGVKLEARTTTSPGVDITIPAYGLREELVKRAESAARLARNLTTFDYVGGFTANTTNGSTSITNVAGLSYPTSYVGARVTGTGIPTDTVITAVSGTTIYLSKAATATGTAVQISFTDFALPVGYEAKAVMSAGALKQEGATKDYTRLFDGFRETIRFGVAPGATAWVQIQATRSAA